MSTCLLAVCLGFGFNVCIFVDHMKYMFVIVIMMYANGVHLLLLHSLMMHLEFSSEFFKAKSILINTKSRYFDLGISKLTKIDAHFF